mgnify:CR=1 FL=1
MPSPPGYNERRPPSSRGASWSPTPSAPFAVGLLYTLAEEHNLLTGELRIAVLVGFLGAFTTFSTFAFDTSQLIRDDRYIWAASNMVLNNAIGLSLVFVGIWIGRLQGS